MNYFYDARRQHEDIGERYNKYTFLGKAQVSSPPTSAEISSAPYHHALIVGHATARMPQSRRHISGMLLSVLAGR